MLDGRCSVGHAERVDNFMRGWSPPPPPEPIDMTPIYEAHEEKEMQHRLDMTAITERLDEIIGLLKVLAGR